MMSMFLLQNSHYSFIDSYVEDTLAPALYEVFPKATGMFGTRASNRMSFYYFSVHHSSWRLQWINRIWNLSPQIADDIEELQYTSAISK